MNPHRRARFFALPLACALSTGSLGSEGDVILNEIMYHPAGSLESLQYVELFNRGTAAVDLSRWSFTGGVRFVFPEQTTLSAGAYLVVCRDRTAFAARYGGAPALGNFEGKLSHRGEKIALLDARGSVIDQVTYGDRDPWPAGADGHSASLERICPFEPGGGSENWAASNLPRFRGAAGTPGMKNDNHAVNLPPVISDVQFQPPRSGETVVTVWISDADGVATAFLSTSVTSPEEESPETRIPMERIAGDEKRGRYHAAIAPQPEGKLVRFRVQALDLTGTARVQPSENDPRPTYSYSTVNEANPARIPFVYLVQAGAAEKGPGRLSTRRSQKAPATRGNSALLYVPPQGGPVELFDHVRITSRHGGFKVRFHRDQPFRGMTVANFLFEGPSRWTLSEPFSYHLYRLSGVPAPLAEHARVWRDGRPLGYHLVVEQPNRSFLKRNRPGAAGSLYKAIWFGKGIVGQHEKKTNSAGGHEDLLQLIAGLNQGSSEARWKFIEEHFNVEEVAGYFAVSMCISDWDGFHNNYFLHHLPGRSSKWEIYPWDKDKTWGDYDGASPQYDWYEMPLTVGMEGDRSPPLDPHSKANNEPGAFGGLSWWRKGGHLSRPLLANPAFRKAFLVRLRDLCATVFTEEKLLPFLETLERDVAPEVKFRAEAEGTEADEALRAFKGGLESLKNQVKHRRAFILSELEKAGVSRRL